MPLTTDSSIFLFAVLLVIGVLTTKFSSRLGVPSLVMYILVGMLLSEFYYYDNAYTTQLFGILALIVILFKGGMQTKWRDVRPVLKPSISLATAGVLVTTVAIGTCAKLILGVSWLEGFLFGAIVGSTDAAAVFAVFGNQHIRRRLSATLEAESGTNDPMAFFLTISLIELIQHPETNPYAIVLHFFWQMGFGLAMGLGMGKLSVWTINRISLDSSGLYPVLALALAILTYSAAALLHGSGLLAVYVLAVLMGNSDLTYRHSIFRFNEGFAWMMQILMFILLGLLVFPEQLSAITWQGIVLSVLLMFIARPAGVFLSTIGMGYTVREKIFLSWSGLKGAVPIVLATYPLLAGLPNSQMLFNVVFFVVFLSTLVQGTTVAPLADKLGLSEGETMVSPHSLELVSMGTTNAEIMEIRLKQNSPVNRKELREVKLPQGTLITAIIRENKVIAPRGTTRLCSGDILYVLIGKGQREQIRNLLLPQEL